MINGGTLKCWGYSNVSLGITGVSESQNPVLIPSITNAKFVSVAQDSICATLSDGNAKCWGANNFGQVGDGTTVEVVEPVYVSGLIDGSVDKLLIVEVSRNSSCATFMGGKVKCWGFNLFGQLGNGSTSSSSIPVTTSFQSTQDLISMGAFHVFSAFSELYCWGRNDKGQLGIGSSISQQESPVSLGSSVRYSESILLGDKHSCAIVYGQNNIKCWGDNSKGQLGDGTTTQRNSPVSVYFNGAP